MIAILEDDGWTALSEDGSRSAQFEHTVLITSGGCEILTISEEELKRERKKKDALNNPIYIRLFQRHVFHKVFVKSAK